jgi:hypothetical protein
MDGLGPGRYILLSHYCYKGCGKLLNEAVRFCTLVTDSTPYPIANSVLQPIAHNQCRNVEHNQILR